MAMGSTMAISSPVYRTVMAMEASVAMEEEEEELLE